MFSDLPSSYYEAMAEVPSATFYWLTEVGNVARVYNLVDARLQKIEEKIERWKRAFPDERCYW